MINIAVIDGIIYHYIW